MSRFLASVSREWQRADRLFYLVTALVTGILTTTALELWAARLDVPLTYTGDAIATGAHFKTVIETGWYESQSYLGAPYGQTYNDFPTADNLHFIAARILSFFTSDWAVAMNVYFIIGFPLAAVAAAWLLRRLSVSRTFSLALGAIYALAPYHFTRGESHLWLASYYVIPFAIWIVIRAIRGDALWAFRNDGPRLTRWATKRSFATLAILALTGTAQSYYAIFFLVLLAFGGVASLIRTGEWRRFWGAAIAGGATAIVMLVNMSPDILYSLVNGHNPSGLERGPSEAEIYALKLTQLLLPWPGHRIDFLRNVRAQYDAHYPLISEQPALGAIAALGLVALFLILAWAGAAWGGVRKKSVTSSQSFRTLTQLAALTFVAFLFSTVGGLSTIVSFFTSSLRGWNRMSIVIAILCLAAVGILCDLAVRWLQSRATRVAAKRAIAVVVATCLLAIGYVDQTPLHPSAPYAQVAEQFDADSTWIAQVEASVPDRSMVFQLPYQPYPESLGATGVLGSEALIPYLHSTHLSWSAGGIKGRPRADWPSAVEQLPPEQIATLVAAAGFAGIHIDRASLTPDEDAELERGLSTVADRAIESASGRYAFYPVLALRDQLTAEFGATQLGELGERIADPVIMSSAPGFQTSIDDGVRTFIATSPEPTISLTNEREDPIPLTVELAFESSDPQSTGVEFTLSDGTTQIAHLVDGKGTIRMSVTAPTGVSSIGLHVVGGGDDLTRTLALTRYTAVEQSVAAALGLSEWTGSSNRP